MKTLVVFALGTMVILGTVSAQTVSKRSLVGNLKQSVTGGCGCYFQFRGTPRSAERYIFFWPIVEDDKMALMNIAGCDLELKLESEEGPLGKERERVGSRSTARFGLGDVKVRVTLITTRVCDPNDEDCASADYNATFTVTKGTRSQLVKAVGSCGC